RASAVGFPLQHQHHVVPKPAATQSAAPADVGANVPAYRALPTVTARAAPMAGPAVPRHTLEGRTECVSSARSGLCGGRRGISVSTAINGSNSQVLTPFRWPESNILPAQMACG